jgi:hypothetical protein
MCHRTSLFKTFHQSDLLGISLWSHFHETHTAL